MSGCEKQRMPYVVRYTIQSACRQDYRNQGGTASDSDLVPFGMGSFFMKTFVPDK